MSQLRQIKCRRSSVTIATMSSFGTIVIYQHSPFLAACQTELDTQSVTSCAWQASRCITALTLPQGHHISHAAVRSIHSVLHIAAASRLSAVSEAGMAQPHAVHLHHAQLAGSPFAPAAAPASCSQTASRVRQYTASQPAGLHMTINGSHIIVASADASSTECPWLLAVYSTTHCQQTGPVYALTTQAVTDHMRSSRSDAPRSTHAWISSARVRACEFCATSSSCALLLQGSSHNIDAESQQAGSVPQAVVVVSWHHTGETIHSLLVRATSALLQTMSCVNQSSLFCC